MSLDERSVPLSRAMLPDDRLPLGICRRDGSCRYRAEPLRDAPGTDIVGRDQRDKPIDLSTLPSPVSDGCGCFGRVSAPPVLLHQRPTELGLSVTSCVCIRRRRPAARVEDHETGLTDYAPGGFRRLENEHAEPVDFPTLDGFLDRGADVLDGRDGLFA